MKLIVTIDVPRDDEYVVKAMVSDKSVLDVADYMQDAIYNDANIEARIEE